MIACSAGLVSGGDSGNPWVGPAAPFAHRKALATIISFSLLFSCGGPKIIFLSLVTELYLLAEEYKPSCSDSGRVPYFSARRVLFADEGRPLLRQWTGSMAGLVANSDLAFGSRRFGVSHGYTGPVRALPLSLSLEKQFG